MKFEDLMGKTVDALLVAILAVAFCILLTVLGVVCHELLSEKIKLSKTKWTCIESTGLDR